MSRAKRLSGLLHNNSPVRTVTEPELSQLSRRLDYPPSAPGYPSGPPPARAFLRPSAIGCGCLRAHHHDGGARPTRAVQAPNATDTAVHFAASRFSLALRVLASMMPLIHAALDCDGSTGSRVVTPSQPGSAVILLDASHRPAAWSPITAVATVRIMLNRFVMFRLWWWRPAHYSGTCECPQFIVDADTL